jgi:hypothetical protein
MRAVSAAGLGVSSIVGLACALLGAVRGSELLWVGSLVAILGMFQFTFALVLGEYMARLLNASLRRPLYVVDECFGFESPASGVAGCKPQVPLSEMTVGRCER